MATYVIETYLSRARAAELDVATARMRDAIAVTVRRVTRSSADSPVRLLRAYFVPEDEMCVYVIEAPSSEAAADVSRRAGLRPERVLEAEAREG